MNTWMFIALLWFEDGASWPDIIWSYTYSDLATCEFTAQKSANEWSRWPQVKHIIVSECFRFVYVRNQEA